MIADKLDDPKKFPVRVFLSRKDNDNLTNGAHEVLLVDETSASRRSLEAALKAEFDKIETGDAKERCNVPGRCFWGSGVKVEHLKAVWDTNSSSAGGWGACFNETEVTDKNVMTTLATLKRSSPNSCALSIVLGLE